jgi:hypothetical protein
MASNTASLFGAVPARDPRGQTSDNSSPARLGRSVGRGRLRGRLGARGWACPDCGLRTEDPVALQLGFCSRCHEFTGMCSAGRKVVCKDMLSQTSWHTPCTSLGTVAWQMTVDTVERVTFLCPTHDAEVRAGRANWIRGAVPVEDLAGH